MKFEEFFTHYLKYNYIACESAQLDDEDDEIGRLFILGAIKQARNESAEAEFVLACNIEPVSYYDYYFKARCYLSLYELSKKSKLDLNLKSNAEDSMLIALQLFNEFTPCAAFIKGWLELYFKRYDNAQSAFKNALSMDNQLVAAYYNRGFAYMAKKQYNAAALDFERALSFKIPEKAIYKFLGNAYFKLNNYTYAARFFDMYLRASDAKDIKVLGDCARSYIALGNYESAERALTIALTASPEDVDLRFLRAQCYIALSDYARAISDYTKVIVRFPNECAALIERGNAYLHIHQLTDAIDDFNAVLKINPNETAVHYNLAQSFMNAGKYNEAAENFTRVLQMDKNDADALFCRAQCLLKAGQTQQALEDFERLAEKDAQACYRCWQINKTLGRQENAQQWLIKAVERGVKHADALYEYALLVFEKGDFTRCIGLCKQAIEIDSSHSQSIVLCARAYRALGDVESAKIYLSRSNDEQSKLELAQIYRQQGQYESTIKLLKEEIDEINNPQAAFLLGEACFKNGDLMQAKKSFLRAIELDKDNSVAYNNLGKAFEALGQKNEALKNYDAAIKINPDYACALNNRGVLHFDRAEYEQAERDLNNAAKLEPQNALIVYNRAVLYEFWKGKKQPELAIKEYRKALSLDPSEKNAAEALRRLFKK